MQFVVPEIKTLPRTERARVVKLTLVITAFAVGAIWSWHAWNVESMECDRNRSALEWILAIKTKCECKVPALDFRCPENSMYLGIL